MVKRKRVGLVYSYDENWVAGSYYIMNIIHALNTIGENLKPEIILLERLSILKVKNEPTICVQKRGNNSYPIWFFSNKYIIEKFKKNKYKQSQQTYSL